MLNYGPALASNNEVNAGNSARESGPGIDGSIRDPDAQDLPSSTTTTSSRDPSSSPQQQYDVDVDIDPNLDRRKRRRVTPISLSEDNHVLSNSECNKHPDSWRDQLKEAASSLDPSPSSCHSTPSTPRRSARIAVITDPHEGKDGYSQDVSPPSPPTATSPDRMDGYLSPKRSPKQRMLQLTKKGRLGKTSTAGQKSKDSTIVNSKQPAQTTLRNGRIVASKKIVLRYSQGSSSKELGKKIDQILEDNVQSHAPCAEQATVTAEDKESKPKKATHPFFLGKPITKPTPPSIADEQTTRETTAEPPAKKPVPWSEIKFSTQRLSHPRDTNLQAAPWPPLSIQHRQSAIIPQVPIQYSPRPSRAKQKQDLIQLDAHEDVLRAYGAQLSASNISDSTIRLPHQLHMTGKDVVATVDRHRHSALLNHTLAPAFQRIHSLALTHQSNFDMGRASGPKDWAHAYAPNSADATLQPKAQVLLEWLTRLKVHQVQSKMPAKNEAKPQPAKRGRKRKLKKGDDQDDFIVDSSDDEYADATPSGTVIVLVGPSGCGKTATVYAVAKELDFEVFEIHPGMRRTARDIYDKVGDMALNHLVHPSAALSRDVSNLTDGTDQTLSAEEAAMGKQSTMAGFLGKKKQPSRPVTPAQSDKGSVQKQSLILFEEVDILFEEDKSFWSGVQTLAKHSKRPIVLTCHDTESIPYAELEIFDTVHFERPEVDAAADYLTLLAAAEGHILKREDLRTLYLGRGHDLRASITELNFWCQMTVGSKLGGLDWMHPGSSRPSGLRTISQGTFYEGLDLVPESGLPSDEILDFAETNLGLPILEWEERRFMTTHSLPETCTLQDFSRLAEARSCMGLMDQFTAAQTRSRASAAFPDICTPPRRSGAIQSVLKEPIAPVLSRKVLMDMLDPISEDFRIFPPTTGRAISIDGTGHALVTEVAPYVRFIVGFDQRLEEQRMELGGGSQSTRQRKTRAARAALEGGDKANTRREKWFPKDLDYKLVLGTGFAGICGDGYATPSAPEENLSSPASQEQMAAAVHGDEDIDM
jgi:DNA polymerase III delta prime subunit